MLTQESLHIFTASLAGGRIEVTHLLFAAVDVNVPEDRDEETSHEVVEGVEVVEPVS